MTNTIYATLVRIFAAVDFGGAVSGPYRSAPGCR